MSLRQEVVISGVGIVSPLGSDIQSTWCRLLDGTNGISRLGHDHVELVNAGIRVAGRAAPFEFDRFSLSSRQRRVVKNAHLETQMLVYAGLAALDDAGIRAPEQVEEYGVAAVIGAGTALDVRDDFVNYDERPPQWVLGTYPNLHLAALSLAASLKGFGNTVVAACTSGAQALGQALWMVRSGRAPVVLAGATENKLLAPFGHGFRRLGMSTPEDDPERAMRPFDRRRNGFVIGQGASVLVVESLRHAEARRITPKARLIGFGSAMDAKSMTDADRAGIAASMRAALADAGVQPGQVSYVNAHGTSTPCNDREESMAIKEVFGRRAFDIPVSSTKSMIGHTFAACGAIEAAVCVMSLLHRKAHITRGFEEGGADCDLDYVKGRPRDLAEGYCLSHSSGLGGLNATLVFGRA